MSGRSVFARGRVVRVVCALAGSSALLLAGCADNSDSGSSSGSSSETATVDVAKVDSIAATLPDKIKSAGKLVIGVNVPYAPNEFKDSSGKIVGFDVDLMTAVSKVLGVTPEFTESDFDKIIPAIQAGTYDMGMSSFTDSKEREQTVDFTTYFSAGIQWAQQTGKPIDPNNACGKRVAVQSTTVEDTDEIPAKSDACVKAGKPAIDKQKFDRQDDAASALALGKVDAMSADSPVTAYAIKQSGGKLEAAGQLFDSAPYGWPVAKGSPLAGVLQQALQHLIDDGSYKKVAQNWGVEAGVIDKSVINGAVN
ncbi:ABC transporter substrate-binding protein [Antrihabitans cavernicola]|uniref:ABC transporter substrate-binding protein n=1 Tax=Antrihabitans cavernicola TaxID=2495913 RepID=A0A5A7S8V8_9NOCA|nr:ABC transporter substrate-binding protein [Spelaeibacter cavernicola]KAA0021073.1 ABC transporter substrate-binding protein [Spelaeibacter cavernicola]